MTRIQSLHLHTNSTEKTHGTTFKPLLFNYLTKTIGSVSRQKQSIKAGNQRMLATGFPS